MGIWKIMMMIIDERNKNTSIVCERDVILAGSYCYGTKIFGADHLAESMDC